MASGVATTTAITASMPMALTLIEAIAGRDKAQAMSRDLGLMSWDARHVSAAFSFTRPFALTAIGNTLTFWSHELLGIEVTPGLDEVSLALVADAWSRKALRPSARAGEITHDKGGGTRYGICVSKKTRAPTNC
jgi:hypothetical protein